MKTKKKYQTAGTIRSKNVQRTSGSQPLSEYSPSVSKFSKSGNLIPVGAKKHPTTGKPLRPAVKKSGGMTKSKKK